MLKSDRETETEGERQSDRQQADRQRQKEEGEREREGRGGGGGGGGGSTDSSRGWKAFELGRVKKLGNKFFKDYVSGSFCYYMNKVVIE